MMSKSEATHFVYDAFISYRHEEPDMTIAKKLIVALEGYKAPIGASKNGTKKITKIFRDREELPATDDLSESIKYALQNSRFLIVICSPHVRQKPQWIESEIECFSKYRGKQFIQTLLIEGEPEEAFPDSLLYENVRTLLPDGSVVEERNHLEFLAADIRPDELKTHDIDKKEAYGISPEKDKVLLKKAVKLLKTERLRCLAPMLGCKFDDLYRRHTRRMIRNTLIGSAAAILLLGGFLGYALRLNGQLTMQIQETEYQRQEADRQAGIALANEDLALQNAEEATEQRIEAERQAELARVNEEKATLNAKEATKQKNEATEQRNEATLQRKEAEIQAELARRNEEKATLAAKEALLQRENAEHQAEIARINEEKAIANAEEARRHRAEAEKQTNIAIDEKNNALISQSLFLADLSKQQLEKGDRATAIMLALEALPKSAVALDRPIVLEAEEALRTAMQKTYSSFIPGQHITTNSYLHTVDISTDNRKLVTTSEGEDFACVWDVRSGMLLQKLEDSGNEVQLAKFSPDGSKIVTSSWYNTIMWDARTGEKLYSLYVFQVTFDEYDRVKFSPDGSKLYVYSKIFNTSTGKLLTELKGHSNAITAGDFNPDGSKLVTASYDGTAIIWEVATGKILSVLDGDSDFLYYAEYSPDGSRIVTASINDSAVIWEAATGKILHKLETSSMVKYASFSPDSKMILTKSLSEITIWDISNGEQEQDLKITGLNSFNHWAVFLPNNFNVITASDSITLWNVYSETPSEVLMDFDNASSTQVRNMVIVSKDGSNLVAVSGKNIMVWQAVKNSNDEMDNTRANDPYAISSDDSMILTTSLYNATIWDTSTREPISNLVGHTSYLREAEFSPDGSKVISYSFDKSAILWDVATGNIIHKFQFEEYVQAVHFSPDGSKALIATMKDVIVWDVVSNKKVTTFKEASVINSAQFSPDSSMIVTAISSYNTAKIWDATTGKELRRMSGHKDDVNTAQFSPDGTKIVTASNDDTAILWDVRTGQPLYKLEGHTGDVNTASFSPDGLSVVTATYEMATTIWEVATGKPITTLEGLTSCVNSAQFSPDGKQVVAAARNGFIIVWDVATAKPTLRLYSIYGMDTASFSQTGSKILAKSYMIKDYKPLDASIKDARELIGKRELTDLERKEYYLE